MAGQKGYSRLHPIYLASRHAGVTFMLVALGLAAGLAWRCLVQPVHYSSDSDAPAAVQPASAGSSFNWQGKLGEWRDLLDDPRTRAILSNNLRHAVKLSAARDATLDAERLAGELLLLENGSGFTASLLYGLAARIGPKLLVRTRDLASNLDFQSLAVIAADLDPPGAGAGGGGGWDFSFFQPAAGVPVLARPGPDDYYFRVLYRLHSLVNAGRDAASPEEAWRSAVDEITARLERENQFAGGGGFGPIAKRELMREIQAIPVLAANGLYSAGGWEYGEDTQHDETELWTARWRNAETTLRPAGSGEGVLAVRIGFDLHPLAYPRDTLPTRIQPLAAATVIAYLAAREELLRHAGPAEPAAAVITPPARPEDPEPLPSEPPAPGPAARVAAKPIIREIVDAEAAERRLEKIKTLEEAVRTAKAGHPALIRRFETSRENVGRLSAEALALRERADRFKERYEEASQLEYSAEARTPPETVKLLADRDAFAKRLAALLQYCTEEHPFVVEVRRNMAALDLLLEEHNPSAQSAREAELRATRLANLYLEWESASASADGMEERLRRQSEAADCLLEELTDLEQAIARDVAELDLARATPVPMIRIEEPAPVPEPEPAPEIVPVPLPAPAPVPAVASLAATPYLRISPLPVRIPLHRQAPDWTAVWAGLAAGALAGLAIALLREMLGKRFYRAGEASHLIGLRVLAVLPRYDAKSMREAAKTAKGEVVGSKGAGLTFRPSPVDFAEPPPAAKRGKIKPARRLPRIWAWAAGLLFVLLAAGMYYRSDGGFIQPPLWIKSELAVPNFTVVEEVSP